MLLAFRCHLGAYYPQYYANLSANFANISIHDAKISNPKSKLAFSAVKLASLPAMLKYGGTYEKQQ